MKTYLFGPSLWLSLSLAGCGSPPDSAAVNNSATAPVDHSVVGVLRTPYRRGTLEVIQLRADQTYIETITRKNAETITHQEKWISYPPAPNDPQSGGETVMLKNWIDASRIDRGKSVKSSQADMVFDRSLFRPLKK